MIAIAKKQRVQDFFFHRITQSFSLLVLVDLLGIIVSLFINAWPTFAKFGARFISQSDTEVVLNADHYWGEACQHRFNGMWAFAIYDQDQKTLFASRDRFGVKPFYYSQIENRFAFASEQKALLTLPWVPFQVNQEAVFDYFLFSQIEYQAAGFFDGITELPAGHCLTFSLNNRNI
jgi:asparagine synthase (glutamine-hydrolysing)